MVESVVLDFDKSPTFMKKWNKEFDVEDIGTNCFYIVLIDDVCDDNISDVLDAENKIKYDEEHLLSLECTLKYEDDGDTSYVSLDGDVTHTFAEGESFNMKGVFVTNESGYVMGYSINQYSFNINNQFIMDDGLKLWTISEAKLNGE